MDFQGTLRAVIEGRERIGLRRTHPRHLDAERLLVDMGALAAHSKNDYNKVDMEHEMSKLDQNRGRFVTYSALLDKRYTQLREMLTNIR
jgi:flagellar basal body rod protein FlgB